MDYTQLFRKLREARGLKLEDLARLARVHRNTVVNIESGRPVRFKTIATLMRKMGYEADSPELRGVALLWLEAVSGVSFSRPETAAAAVKTISALRTASRERASALQQAIADANLSPEQIDLLIQAARRPGFLSILATVRDLAAELGQERPGSDLRAAEPKSPYGKK